MNVVVVGLGFLLFSVLLDITYLGLVSRKFSCGLAHVPGVYAEGIIKLSGGGQENRTRKMCLAMSMLNLLLKVRSHPPNISTTAYSLQPWSIYAAYREYVNRGGASITGMARFPHP